MSIEIVPPGMRGGDERVARNVIERDGFDKSRSARRRPAIGGDEKFDQADREARPGIDRRKSGRIPALTEETGAFPRPDGMGAGDNAPKPEGQCLLEGQAVFEGVENLLGTAGAKIGSRSFDRVAAVEFGMRSWS